MDTVEGNNNEKMIFPKSLIIGLGGIGSDVVSKVYQRFLSRHPSPVEQDLVGFICFDTDENDSNLRREVMPRELVVQTSASANITVAGYLDKIRNRSSVEEWFETQQRLLLELTLNDGAGQIRMASRLALSLAIEENKFDIVQNVINRILRVQADKTDGNDIRVHIVSTMAGGTGAGSFMQVSYLIKEILRHEKGLDKPRITGYFLLADVLCQDSSTQFDEQKTENALSNSYASIKELNGIYNYEKTSNGFNIDFEYRFFTDAEEGHKLPDFEPFEVSYLYDFEDSKGGNRGKKENYYDQIEDYLFLNVFSPIGAKTRSAAINDILLSIKTGGVNRYASTGVAKIKYPVEEIFRYFSVKRVSDNLKNSWLKIDTDYNNLLKEYKRQINLGIIADKPQLDKFFMDQVEYLSKNGTGIEKVIFRKIFQNTQEYDKNGTVIGVKSITFIKELMAYLSRAKENKTSINDLSDRLHLPIDFQKSNDTEQDHGVIQANETTIKSLYKEVMAFVENTKSLGIEEGLIADYNEPNFLSNSVSRINTYILRNEQIMHPITVRYYLYDLRKQMSSKLQALKAENEKSKEQIDGYSNYFDIKDDQEKDDHIETAAEAYEIYTRQDKKIMRKLSKIFGKSGSLAEFKEKYITRTKKQVVLLNYYAVTKLQEEVITGLLGQINLMIDEIELLFKNLANIHSGLQREADSLLKLHKNQSNKSTQFVLSTPELKEKIYNEKISIQDDLDFPQDLSRLIYEGLYKNVYQKTNKTGLGKAPIQTVSSLFRKDVIDKQTESLKADFNQDIAEFNVIKAIRYEAALNSVDEFAHLKKYFSEAVKLANPLGAKNIFKSPHINSWAMHPECFDPSFLSETEADEILGDVGDRTNGAYRVKNKFFSKYEVIREDSRFLLSVPENYPQFSSGSKSTKYSTAPVGKYFKAYKSRIEDVLEGVSVSPHLDKRWHFPGYFPDIGESREVLAEKIYRAFFWGIINGELITREESGDQKWIFVRSASNTTREVLDQHQKRIRTTFSDLIFKGLFANPGMVDSILESAQNIIADNKVDFEEKAVADKISAMLNLPIIKSICEYSNSNQRKLKNLTLIQILDKVVIKDKEKILNVILNSIVDTCKFIGGDNSETTKAVKKLIDLLLGKQGKTKHPLTGTLDNILKQKSKTVSPQE